MSIFASLYLTFTLFLILTLLGSFSFLSMNHLFRANWLQPFLPRLRAHLNLVWLGLVLWVGIVFIAFPFLKNNQLIHPECHFRELYLSRPFFLLRSIICWVIWIWLALRLKRENFKNGALVVLLVLFTGTFAITDWIMLFEVGWSSTIFALNLLLSALLISFHINVLSLVKSDSNAGEFKLLLDWNSVQMTLVALWTYLSLMQWITIWEANLPNETGLYFHRSEGFWLWAIIAISFFQSVLPIFTLLFRGLKKSILYTRTLSFASLLSQLLFLYWIFGAASLRGAP